ATAPPRRRGALPCGRPRRARERRRGGRRHARRARRAARRRELPALVAAEFAVRAVRPLRLPPRLPPRACADARPRRERAGARALVRAPREGHPQEVEARRSSGMRAPATDDAAARERAATDFDHNLCVTAGAGCGKTSLLVERVLYAVLARGTPLERI